MKQAVAGWGVREADADRDERTLIDRLLQLTAVKAVSGEEGRVEGEVNPRSNLS